LKLSISSRAWRSPNWNLAITKLHAENISIMVVGDSISQGSEGDWTWRYRLWEWLNSEGIAADFVGPFIGTRPPELDLHVQQPAPQGLAWTDAANSSGGYSPGIDENFVSNHFAIWGRQLALDKDLIHGVVKTYNPEYLLVLLGYNDLAWYPIFSAEDTLQNMRIFVDAARAAKHDLKFAIGNIPMRLSIDDRPDLPVRTKKYNEILAAAIPSWSTASSPIKLVDMQQNYDCSLEHCPAGYDGLHPNALGEYQIAQAFALTLTRAFRVGISELVIPGTEIKHETNPGQTAVI